MRELKTIQRRGKLNTIYAIDEPGNGGANHRYRIVGQKDKRNPEQFVDLTIQFQNGARNEWGSMLGVLDTELLEIVRDRLIGFQQGKFATRENALALTNIEQALLWLNKRVEDRIERNVLGTSKE